MSKNYPTTDYTFEALKTLGAEQRFVNFKTIFNEVKKIRLNRGLIAEDKNTKGRVRRSLVYNDTTAQLRNSEQGDKLSISIKYPEYKVISEKPIAIKTNGMIDNSEQVESNKFMLIKK